MSKHLLIFFSTLILSGTASGLTSICSGEFLPLTGATTLKHETSWSYHDNWFFNMYIKVGSELNGPVSTTLVDEFEMKSGGNVLHFLENPPDGNYTLQGTVQIGYPLPWGFEGYYGIECPKWAGDIVNNDNSPSEGDLEAALKSVSSVEQHRVGPVQDCQAFEGSGCSVEQGSLGGLMPSEALESDPLVGFIGPRVSTTGILDAVGAESLTLRTFVGRYVNFTLDPAVKLTRQSVVNHAEIRAGDAVGVYWASANEFDTNALQVRIYKGFTFSFTTTNESIVPAKNPGLELRSVINSVERAAGKSMRLVYANGLATMQIPEDATVTVVEPKHLKDLSPGASFVRVTAQRNEAGQLVAKAIDILN